VNYSSDKVVDASISNNKRLIDLKKLHIYIAQRGEEKKQRREGRVEGTDGI
jgi:hypothetical protein